MYYPNLLALGGITWGIVFWVIINWSETIIQYLDEIWRFIS